MSVERFQKVQEDIYAALDSGHYKVKYPEGDHDTKLVEYHQELGAADEAFRRDAIKFVKLEGHPKADKAYSLAYQRGHAAGYHDILNELVDLADLLL